MRLKKKIIVLISVALFLINGLFQLPLKAYSFENPLVVKISTDWCFACKILEPTFEELKSQYGDRVTFVTLNLTNEESKKEAGLIASYYGISQFLNENSYAFPRVAIFCSTSIVPEFNILGANKKETYTQSIDQLLNTTTCNLSGRPPVTAQGPDRPQGDRPNEPQFPEVIGSRPGEPNFLDRPNEIINSGRPPELSFWPIGQIIPLYAYYQYLLLPKCGGYSDVVCSKNTTNTNNQNLNNNDNSNNAPVYKPWTPNATRDEKGLHL
ncbi:MAG: hypothetical protein HYY52_08330 [Candidatus Melainabacteria bacterium]|nr:hypothetical protein [Candidatus Melainabacteria bacterium]